MNLFERGDMTASLRFTTDEIKKEIDKLTNELICSTDLDDLEEYYVAKYQIEEIDLLEDSITKELSEIKIKSCNHFYCGGYRDFEPKYYMIDGYRVTFTIPFDGDKNLLDLRPSSFYMQSFPVDRVVAPMENDFGKIIYSLEFSKKELQDKENSNDFVQKKFDKEMKTYFSTIDTINQEVKKYNATLPKTIKQYLNQRLQKANDYLQMRERLELPLKLKENAPNTTPILLKKKKKKEAVFPNRKAPEKEYEISNADYENIKNIILLACTSMEKSARTFTKLLEEELRDVILSNLNTHYQGTASGETFNKVGKTDIYIPFENKAAYIAECKVWHGNKKFIEAIDQLCGYTTWRDTKTSLVIFNKDNKNFGALLDSVNNSLRTSERCKEIIQIGHNQWQGIFTKEVDSKDTLTINVTVYDLYVKE